MGRPSHAPTKETRALVVKYARAFISQEQIAGALGISVPTLEKHYRDELDKPGPALIAEAASQLALLIEKGNLGAICFALKCKGGWRETDFKEAAESLADSVRKAMNVPPIKPLDREEWLKATHKEK